MNVQPSKRVERLQALRQWLMIRDLGLNSWKFWVEALLVSHGDDASVISRLMSISRLNDLLFYSSTAITLFLSSRCGNQSRDLAADI